MRRADGLQKIQTNQLKNMRYLKWKFAVHFLLSKSHLIAGIWILFMLSQGFTLTQIAILDVALFGAILLFEVPTGYIADWLGRKISVILCYVIQAGVVLFFLSARHFWQFSLIFFIWGIGITMRSGAEEAWIYDELVYIGQLSGIPPNQIRYRYQQFVGFLGTIGLFAIAFGQVMGGYIAGRFSFRIAFYTAFVIYAGAVIWLITIPEHPLSHSLPDKEESDPQFRAAMHALKTPPVLLLGSIIILTSMIAGSMLLFMQAYLDFVGFGIATIGLIYGLKSGMTAIGSSLSARIISPKRNLVVFPLISILGVSYFLMNIKTKEIILIAYFIISAIYGLLLPYFFSHINQHIDSKVRATTISLISLIGSIFVFLYELSFARIIENLGFKWYFYSNALLVLGLMFPLSLKWWQLESRKSKYDDQSGIVALENDTNIPLITT